MTSGLTRGHHRRDAPRLPLPAWPAALLVCLAAALPFVSTLNSYFLADDFGLIQQFSRRPLKRQSRPSRASLAIGQQYLASV
jgi:hypothetical protein